MAKQPETIDRFKLIAIVEQAQLGPIIAALTRLGVQHLDHEMVTDVNAYKQRPQFDKKSKEVVMEYVAEHPTFEISEVVKLFEEQGRTNSAAYAAVNSLVESKVLKKLSLGNYSAAGVKQIAGPDKSALKKLPKLRQAKEKPIIRDTTNKDFIWKMVKGRKGFTIYDLTKLFKADGRNAKSISPQVNSLVKEKRIKSLGDGVYEVIQAKAAKSAKSAKPAAKPAAKPNVANASLNGAANAEITNG